MGFAALMGMTGVATAVGRDSHETFLLTAIANIVDQCPGPIESGRAEVVRIPANRIACGHADPAIDALNGLIGFYARLVVRRDGFRRVMPGFGWCEGCSYYVRPSSGRLLRHSLSLTVFQFSSGKYV